MLRSIFTKAFGIRGGEISIALLMQLYIFLIITTLLMVKPTVTAVFLNTLGADHLPYAFILTAISAVVFIFLYNKAVAAFRMSYVIIISLISFSSLFFILSHSLAGGSNSVTLLYLYYLLVALFAVVATSQFWVLANLVFNPREAKRLFGFIGAGAIAGGVLGGYLTSYIASTFDNQMVIYIASAILLACIPIVLLIWKKRISGYSTYKRRQRKTSSSESNLAAYRLILKSKHLTYIALLTGIGVVVAKLIDYQFSDLASEAISDPSELSAFFGFWYSNFNVAALFIQLFLTNRIARNLGVNTSLLILPLGIVLASILFLFFPELSVMILIKGIDGGFKQSINKAALELSIMPVPSAVKNKAKSFIDVAVDSLASGATGVLLIVLIKYTTLSSVDLVVIIILLVICWFLCIYGLREAYFHSFVKNIQNSLEGGQELNPNLLSKEPPLTTAKRILSTGQEDAIIEILDRLREPNLSYLKSEIINLLDHKTSRIKTKAVQTLSGMNETIKEDRIEKLLNIKNNDLIYEIMQYTLQRNDTNDEDVFEKYLNHQNSYFASAALRCLAEESAHNATLASKYNLYERIASKVKQIENNIPGKNKDHISQLMISIAHAGITEFYHLIESNLYHAKLYRRRKAIKAAGITVDPRFLPILLPFLTIKSIRKRTIKSLIAFGPKLSDEILTMDRLENITDGVKVHLPKVIQAHNNQNAVKILFQLVRRSQDVFTRYSATRSLLKLRRKNDSLNFNKDKLQKLIIKEQKYYSITIDSLRTTSEYITHKTKTLQNNAVLREQIEKLENLNSLLIEHQQHSLRVIFNLLTIMYDNPEMSLMYSGLVSNKQEARINALEFLENLLSPNIKKILFPLLEFRIEESYLEQQHIYTPNNIGFSSMIFLLMKGRGRRMKLQLLYLIHALKDDQYNSLVLKMQTHKNQTVREAAAQIISKD